MYGYFSGGNYVNPATNAMSCPSGFSQTPVLGHSGTDFPLILCYRKHFAGSQSVLDFGGMYGFAAGGVVYKNPATQAASCPNGYTATPVLGTAGFDFPIYLCHRPHVAGSSGVLSFGGAFGYAGGGNVYPNPATQAANCPSGYVASPALGSSGTDFPVYFCHKATSAGNSCQFGHASIPHGGSIPAFESPKVSQGQTCKMENRSCTDGKLAGSFSYASCEVEVVLSSCQVNGATIQSGTSKKFYLVDKIAAGDSCDEAGLWQTRSCTDGKLSGSAAFVHSTCAVGSGLSTQKAALKEFLPYVWSTTWYPYFNNTVGVDPVRGLQLLEIEIDRIKAAGLNTLWMGGNAIWKALQPRPGEWDEVQFQNLTKLLELMKKKNMRAIYQFNYVGPGFSPEGIDGCKWFQDSNQVQKFTQFSTELVGRLQAYNHMIYYMVYTEQSKQCLLDLGLNYYYKGYRMDSLTHSTTLPDQEPYQTYQYNDVHKVNNYLKQSIGRFTKQMPRAIRNLAFIGIHDVTVSDGHITDDTPVEGPSDFDYFSFAYYPEESEVKNQSNYPHVLTSLSARLQRIRLFYPETPILLGEFGWTGWDGKNFGAIQHSLDRNVAHEAMIDWSIANKVGFNVWGWLPRYLDDPSLEQNPYEEGLQLRMRDGSLSTVVDVIRKKLTGM